MNLGLWGLGRMGANMARRLARGGVPVVVHNRTVAKASALAAEEPGVTAAGSPAELAGLLSAPRVVWLMLPAEAVDAALETLATVLAPGDLVVEGGNSHYRDDARRAALLGARGLRYMDVGVSGGVWGLAEGYCLMVGGAAADYALLQPALAALAAPGGHLHAGPVGSGHFLKMVHNAIEYGMMQAYAEGFELLRNGPFAARHDFAAICRLWSHGSVVRSWLLELLERVFARDPGLEEVKGYVEDSGEGRWSVLQAVESETFAPVIALSLLERFRSRRNETFGDKVLASLRREFGGHAVKREP